MTLTDPTAAVEDLLEALEKAVEVAREARVLVEETWIGREAAEVDAAAARQEIEKVEDLRARDVTILVETVRNLHDRAKHGGPLRFCVDETCTIWTDLFISFGWGT